MTNPKRVNWTRCSVSGLVLTVGLLLRGRWISILASVARRWSVTNCRRRDPDLPAGRGLRQLGPDAEVDARPVPERVVTRRLGAMRRLVVHPPADFVSANAAAFKALGVTHATFTAGPVVQSASGDQAAAIVTQHYTLPQIGAFEPRTPGEARQAQRQVAGRVVDAHDQPASRPGRVARRQPELAEASADPRRRRRLADDHRHRRRGRTRRRADQGCRRGQDRPDHGRRDRCRDRPGARAGQGPPDPVRARVHGLQGAVRAAQGGGRAAQRLRRAGDAVRPADRAAGDHPAALRPARRHGRSDHRRPAEGARAAVRRHLDRRRARARGGLGAAAGRDADDRGQRRRQDRRAGGAARDPPRHARAGGADEHRPARPASRRGRAGGRHPPRRDGRDAGVDRQGPGGRLRPRRLRVRRGAAGPVPARVDVQGADLDGADPQGPDPGLARQLPADDHRRRRDVPQRVSGRVGLDARSRRSRSRATPRSSVSRPSAWRRPISPPPPACTASTTRPRSGSRR